MKSGSRLLFAAAGFFTPEALDKPRGVRESNRNRAKSPTPLRQTRSFHLLQFAQIVFYKS